MNNYKEYLGKSIVAEGCYYHNSGPEGKGSIESSIIQEGQSSTNNYQRIQVNHSTINTTGLLIDKIKYKFTGLLKSDESTPGDAYILIAEKIEPA